MIEPDRRWFGDYELMETNMDPSSDAFQQLVRKLADGLAGMLATYGVINQSVTASVSAIAVGVISLGWWWIWNRNRVTDAPAAPAK